MKKPVIYTTRGQRADIGPIEIYRLVSNPFVEQVGHFVFLDYIAPFTPPAKQLNPDFAHPHRGIATLTYILEGEAEHYDSRGHRGTVHSGGVQWMKAGNGIIHNEVVGADSTAHGKLMHGFQFWINLPAEEKKKNPEYMALNSEEMPLLPLENNAGTLKVVVGEYGGQTSRIPTYAQQYLYHIQLQAGKSFTFPTKEGLEYAIFLPQNDLTINDVLYEAGDLIGFEEKEGNIEMTNTSKETVECMLFGGEKYTEPYVAYGPFVMSSQEEIRAAYADYRKGKYGEMVYH